MKKTLSLKNIAFEGIIDSCWWEPMKSWLLCGGVVFALLIPGMGNYKAATLDVADVSAIRIMQSGNSSEGITVERSDCYFEALVMIYNMALEEKISLNLIDAGSSFSVEYQVIDPDFAQMTSNFLTIDKNGILLVDDRLLPQKTNNEAAYQTVRKCFMSKKW